jgi:hypothetical protein
MVSTNGEIINASWLRLPPFTKTEKIALIAPQGTIVYDTTAKKISIKTEDANLVGSWENVTSVDDS